VRCSSFRVRRSSDGSASACCKAGPSLITLEFFVYDIEGCGVAQLGFVIAQMVVRRLALRQVRVRFSAGHPREVFPTKLTSDEEMERNLCE
jgi:hypothetical protein